MPHAAAYRTVQNMSIGVETINSGESSLSRSVDVSTLTVQDSEDSPGKQKGQDDDKVVNVQVADALHEDDVKSEGDERRRRRQRSEK